MARRATPDASIGERIKSRRRLRQWSIRFAADRAGIAPSTWSRIERGILAADNRFTLADIARALDCSVFDLTGAPNTATDPEAAAALATVSPIRQALVEIDLREDPVVAPRPLPELERETELVESLRQRCEYVGVGERLPALLRELHAAAQGPDRREALELLVRATFTAAGAVRYFGGHAESWLAAERCREAAEQLEDPLMLALAGYERAHAATGCGTYQRGLTIAERTLGELDHHLAVDGALEMFGQLHLTCGFAALGAGGQLAESLARLDEAADVASRTGDTDTLGLFFGPTNVQFWRISMETDGGEPGRAVELAGRVTPAAVASKSRQVAFYSDLGRALARIGDDDRALRNLLTAERMAPARVRSSALVRETARGLLDRAQRRAGGSALRGLCERVGVTA